MDLKKVFKKGMIVILKDTNRGYEDLIGKKYIVTAIYERYIACKDEKTKRSGYTFYPNDGDIVICAGRKEEAEFLRTRIAEMQKEIKVLEKEAENLEKYETEEDFVAAKLEAIISAGSHKDPKKRVEAIKEIVKTLKETHYL